MKSSAKAGAALAATGTAIAIGMASMMSSNDVIGIIVIPEVAYVAPDLANFCGRWQTSYPDSSPWVEPMVQAVDECTGKFNTPVIMQWCLMFKVDSVTYAWDKQRDKSECEQVFDQNEAVMEYPPGIGLDGQTIDIQVEREILPNGLWKMTPRVKGIRNSGDRSA